MTNLNFSSDEIYQVVFLRQDTRIEEGVLNTYVMSLDTKNAVCRRPLPYR